MNFFRKQKCSKNVAQKCNFTLSAFCGLRLIFCGSFRVSDFCGETIIYYTTVYDHNRKSKSIV